MLLVILIAALSGGLASTARPQSRGKSTGLSIIQPSEEAANLLARTREAVQRQDWKLAVDSLQRIVELPGEHVLAENQERYESARRRAHREIAALPEAGLRAYRVLYDSEASALLDRARRTHDLTLLRSVVDRFLMTNAGDDAAILLADWLMDEGRFSEAAGMLRWTRSVHLDSDLPVWVIAGRLAVCFAAMGQTGRAEATLAQVPASGPFDTASVQSRIEEIRRFIAQRTVPRTASAPVSWPMSFGAPARNALQPPVQVSLLDNQRLATPLPAAEPRAGFPALDQFLIENSLVPAPELVTDGDVLVVKSGREITCLDADSLTQLWTTEMSVTEANASPGEISANQRATRIATYFGQTPIENEAATRYLLSDAIGAGLLIADGMILTVDWPAGPPLFSLSKKRSERLPLIVSGETANLPSNRLIACSLEDGSLRWQSDLRGLSGPIGMEAENVVVTFLSVPVPVDGLLLAPCRVNTDLYAVALDPATGRRGWHVYLCGTGGAFRRPCSLAPTVADGMAFIPTGQGLIVSLDLATRSVQWAVRYPTRQDAADANEWLPTPMIAVGDALLAAPCDADFLFCIDRSTGGIRWQVNRDDNTQMLGASDACAWIAGEKLRMIDLQSGTVAWSRPCGQLTGRGIVASDRIYLPTSRGLASFDATNGEPIEVAQPTDRGMTGNLLAWDGALYSVGLQEVLKYPDLVNGYRDAVARHQADPADASRALRLAWLELLRHHPAEALTALSQVSEALKNENPRKHGQVIRLRVRSLLELAAGDELPADQALGSLRQARSIAESPEDRIQTALALGDCYGRHQRLGDACLQYVSLLLSREADEMVSLEPGLRQRAGILANRRLAETLPRMSVEQRKNVEETVRRAVQEAVGKHDAETLSRLAEGTALAETAAQAQVRLGAWAIAELRTEQAEALLKDALRTSRSPELLAEAAARLAGIYLLPAELQQPVAAHEVLDQIERKWSAVLLPTDLLADPLNPDAPRPAVPERLPATRIVRMLRARLDRRKLERHKRVLEPVMLDEPGEAVVADTNGEWPVLTRSEHNEALTDTLLSIASQKRLSAKSIGSGESFHQMIRNHQPLWQTDLRLPGQPAIDMDPASPITLQLSVGTDGSMRWEGRAPRATADGQTLVINSPYGLHGVGLLTGRRLWSRPFDAPLLIGQQPIASDDWVWAADGFVVSVDARGQIEASRSYDGERIVWSRTLPQRRWHFIRVRGEYVVAADSALQQADIFRLTDGRHVGQCRFVQPASPGQQINLLLFDEVLCGPVSDKEVAAFDLAAPGTERWRASMPEALCQTFKPSPELVGIGDRAGHIEIREPSTGRSRRSVAAPACKEGAIDAALIDDVLYVIGYQNRPTAAGGQRLWKYALAAIRMDSGTILWQRQDIAPQTLLTGEILRMSSNAIPLATSTRSAEPRDQVQGPDGVVTWTFVGPGGTRTEPIGAVELTVVDKQTGQTIGRAVTAALPAGTSRAPISEVSVRPSGVLVKAGPFVLGFPTDGSSGQPTGRDAGTSTKPSPDRRTGGTGQ